ncbi:autotransporter domain-containing protein [Tianweitania sp. BSSL-BM11]|uniref:Autotransporter domain-containing protein n=1 Tax=Tianweitania aestuarii TaxID=2814886 RepID=A0ABS5RRF7_9HYPH|nr:autotransporter domain-containing protein [Tianweitania aestuarii]MBS9719375.1 autotransporter domain-containing protein [Tianweitania aestuarii]
MHKVVQPAGPVDRRVPFRAVLLACTSLAALNVSGFSAARAEPFTMLPSDSQTTAAAPAAMMPFAMQASDVSVMAAGTETIYQGTDSAGSASLATSGDDAVIFRDQATASSAEIINNGGSTRFEDNSTAASAALTANDTGAIRFNDAATAADSRIVVNGGGSLGFADQATAGDAFVTTNDAVRFDNQSTAGNAQITVNQSGTVTFADQADGGIARIANSGATVLEGNASLAGGQITNNETGSVTFRDQASAGTTAFIGNSGSVRFEDASTLGTGSLTNNTAGSIAFTGTSTAADGFISNSGALSFADASSAGTSEIVGNASGAISFAGNSTAAQAVIASAGNVSFSDQATAGAASITIGDGATVAFSDATSGGTAIVQLDDGATLDIRNAQNTIGLNQLTGAGDARLGANTLALGDATPLTNFDGTITDDGAGGGLIKRGTGTLNLSVTSAYRGATLVQDGTLEAGRENAFAAQSAFTVEAPATLALADFDQTIGSLAGAGTVDLVNAVLTTGGNDGSTTFSGVLSGTGGVVKDGTGIFTLSGINSYSGETLVRAGRLTVDGSIAASDVTVDAGASLSGLGTVGSAEVAGTLVAQAAGPFTVAGDLTLDPGAIFAVELDGARAGLVNVGGDVFVNGELQLTNENRAAAGDYRFLAAGGTISGSFDTITASFAFLDPSVLYGASDLTLRLERNAIAFPDVARTRNQRATARAIEAGGVGNGLYDATVALTETEALTAFDLLSGEAHAQVLDTIAGIQRNSRWAVRSHLAQADGPGLWGESGYSRDEVSGDGNAADARSRGPWLTAGVDFQPVEDVRLGVAGHYNSTDFDNRARVSSADITSIGITAYGDWRHGPWRLSGGADYTNHDIDLKRFTAVGDLSGTARSDTSSWTGGAFGELAYTAELGGVDVEPFVGVSWTTAQGGSFAETGAGAANLVSGGSDIDRTDTDIGLRISRAWQMNSDLVVKPSLYAAYSRRLSGDAPFSTHAYAAGMPFTVYGSDSNENAGTVEARLDLAFRQQVDAAVFYRGSFSGDDQLHTVGGALKIGF